MPSTKKSRAKKLSRPAADATCAKSRTVIVGTLQLDVWTCSAPTPGVPLKKRRRLEVAPVLEKLNGRLWQLFYVSTFDVDAYGNPMGWQPGWYHNAVDPDPSWRIDEAIGPYCSFDAALEDLRQGQADISSEC